MEFKRAEAKDLEEVLEIRYKMLQEVNQIHSRGEEWGLNHDLANATEEYFKTGDQITFLAWDGKNPVACATMCYFMVMPTYSHPGGLRAHVMNVYTEPAYRKKGIGMKLIKMLIADARTRGVTHVSLDATADGRPLYERAGFRSSEEGMEMILQEE